MYNTSMHADFIRDHADYGFDVTFHGFNWRLVVLVAVSFAEMAAVRFAAR
jgi:hypothetical protein